MSDLKDIQSKLQIVESQEIPEIKEEEPGTSGMSGDRPQKRAGRRPGRRSSKMDVRAKLERSRQSARECRARKKLRYQYLEDLVANREKAVFALRDELEMYKQWCIQIDSGLMPMALLQISDKVQKTDEISPKRMRLEKFAGDDEDVSVCTTTNPADRMDVESYSIDKTSTNAESLKGSNSDASDLKKGDNSNSDSAVGSTEDEFTWTLDGDIIRIVPRTKDSIFKGNNFVLPTIAEESDE